MGVLVCLVLTLGPWLGLSGQYSRAASLSWDFGGHLRTIGTLQDAGDQLSAKTAKRETLRDLSLETRLIGDLRIGSNLDFTTHYQAWIETGDRTRRQMQTGFPSHDSIMDFFLASH